MEELLDRFESICPLSEADKLLMRRHLTIEEFDKKVLFSEKGRTSRKIGFVLEGVFKVVRMTSSGDYYIPYFLDEGHFVVDIESFSNQTPSEEFIEALTPAKVVSFRREAFDLFEKEITNFTRIFSDLKGKALVEKNRLKSEMLVDSAKIRYKKLLDRHPNLILRVPQNEIAIYLGISQFTLSRVKSRT